jgi:hypothetical protein
MTKSCVESRRQCEFSQPLPKTKPGDALSLVSRGDGRLVEVASASRFALACFGAAHDQFAAKEFLIVQFLDGAFRLFHGLHLDESKTFRTLVVAVANDFRVLHVANAVEQLEEIALGGVEGQISYVKTRRSDFDRLRFARRARLLRPVA